MKGEIIILKNRLIFLFFLFFVLILTACVSNTTSSESVDDGEMKDLKPVTISVGHVGSEGELLTIGTEYFKERVEENTKGKVTIDIYPSSQLGGDRDLIESVSIGSVKMGGISVGTFSNITSAFLALQLPFLIENGDESFQLYQSEIIAETAMKELEKVNMKGLGFIPTGFFQFGGNKSVASLEDMKGLKIRASESHIIMESFHHLGMAPTTMPYSEMYNSLNTGVIDAGALQTATWYNSFRDSVDHISFVNVFPWPHLLVINLDEFNSYPVEYQDALYEAAQETQEYMYKYEKETLQEYTQLLEDETDIQLTNEIDRDSFIEKMQPIYEKYSKESPFVRETIETLNEIREQ